MAVQDPQDYGGLFKSIKTMSLGYLYWLTTLNENFKNLVDFSLVAHNTDGSLKAGVSASEWKIFSGAVTYISANSFSVPSSAEFEVGRKIYVHQTLDVLGSVLTAVTNAGITTVTLENIVLGSDNVTASTLTNDITLVDVSLVTQKTLPEITHPTPPASGLKSVQAFTASGTWNKPAGITKVRTELVGAGGGGAGEFDIVYGGGGGGAGGYATEIIDVSAISSQTVTIGSGGAGGATLTAGSGGGSSSFGSFNSATGGSGAPSPVAQGDGGAGGVGSGGIINITGGRGTGSQRRSAASGGASYFGGGGYNSSVGGGYGSGGGGAIPASGFSGGTGKRGIVIVWEYA